MPGYTHTRKAMPSTAAVWAGSHVDSLAGSLRMLALAADLFDRDPLGSAAGYGSQHRVMGLSGNLLSGYNRDLQLTKGPVMEAFDTVKSCLAMMSLVMEGLGVDRARCRRAMTGELFAAGSALELARKGMPFRNAYRKVGRRYA